MRATVPSLIAALLASLACTTPGANEVRMAEKAQHGALLRAQRALDNAKYPAAIEHADRALRFRFPDPEVEAEAALLKAEACDRLDRPRQAARLYRYVADVHGGTPYASRAEQRLQALEARGVDLSPRPPGAGAEEPLTRLQTSFLLVERPWLERPVEISYPYLAEVQDLEGFVVVLLRSDARGRLADFEILESSHPLFEEAVVHALPRFEFVPEEMAKLSPPDTQTVRFTFRLRGG